ncbi:MAG: SusD/RagB family nutrient-binding outer membrane lipoprotein [Ginsengibacter sp.]
MKRKYLFLTLLAFIITFSSCDKNFVKINTNPVLANDLDPVYQFSNAQQASVIPSYHYQGEIVQQIITPFGGVLEGGNRNTVNENNANATFDQLFTGSIRNLVDIINKLKNTPSRSNLYNMARLWKAYCFQNLVDTYGDVPYFDAGKGFIGSTYLPKYDDQKLIYDDLVKEYKEATDALTEGKDVVSGDLFYKGNIAQWKKLGNSLLLRIGMRYTKIDEAKAKSIAAIAVDAGRGGLMESNNDNAFIQYNAVYNNGTSSLLLGGERANYYIGKPFIDFLKSTNDPRLQFISVKYANPSNPLETAGVADTNPADQLGMPYGYDETSISTAPDYPGKNGSAFNYSQFNRATVARIDATRFLMTYAQTQLLLAEANQRGYVSTGMAKDYYEKAVRAHMAQTGLYGMDVNINSSLQDNYLQQPGIAFEPAMAIEQINEQYWIASVFIWEEAWANFRRSGFPQLAPINYQGADPSVNTPSAGGFIHRLPYPLREKSVNTANVVEATSRMGGDNLGVRIFWDK